MTNCVSNLNNAELDSLLKDLLGKPSADNAFVNEAPTSKRDDSNIAGLCNKVDGNVNSEVTLLDDDHLTEQPVEQFFTRPSHTYSSINDELSDLKWKVVFLSKQLVDKTGELEAKDEELNLVNCKLNNAEKAKERLEKKLISYENIIERMKEIKDKMNEGNEVSMMSVEDVIVACPQNVVPSDGDERPVMKDKHATELPRKQNINNSEIKSKNHRCQFENTGTCRKKNCRKYHPKKTCQNYSYYGVCSFRGCDLRHPWGVCHNWQQYGECVYGERCRNRHPIQLRRYQNVTMASENRFLGWNNSLQMKPHLLPYPPIIDFVRRNNC